MPDAFGNSRKDSEIEVDDVPTRQYVRIEFLDTPAEPVDCGMFVDAPNRFLGHFTASRGNDEHLIGTASVQRNGEQLRRLGICFDVERQH